jgi:hypothetical protein
MAEQLMNENVENCPVPNKVSFCIFECSNFLGGDCLPLRGVEDPKRQRQYEHIKESELKRGRSEEDAERIAAATVNRTRRLKGEV